MHTPTAAALAAFPAAHAEPTPPPNPLSRILLCSIVLTVIVQAMSPSIDLRPAPRAPRVVRVVRSGRR
tara:strand:- start:191 stop:394 length:204 start_codon:yes stop_codon:yes gene_type:complete